VNDALTMAASSLITLPGANEAQGGPMLVLEGWFHPGDG
jgi:hypothetical protein